jgi:aminoglycoside phosphotransferase (APT) family kinase protein
VTIDEPLVRALLAEQHPDLSELPLAVLDAGRDNVVFRLGDRRLVRLPCREESAPLLENELAWLPRVAEGLTLPVPVPERAGRPGRGYPWRWSVVPWFDGITADIEPLDPSQAPVLALFLRALHRPAPADAPPNPYRGIPLAARTDMPARFERVLAGSHTESDTVLRLWERALAAPPATEMVWIHGDLHPRNLLGRGGELTAVLDWGDMAVGDPATDLAAAWMLFDHWSGVDAVFDTYGASSALVRRALGWAIVFGIVFQDLGLPDPYPRLGRNALAAAVRYGGG